MPQAQAVHLTHADYVELPDDGRRYEIIRGKLYVSPSPFSVHQIVLATLYDIVKRFVRDRSLGKVLFAPLDVILADDSVVQPDLIFISGARSPAIVGRWIHGAPDLVVEVLSKSTSRKDRLVKRQLYADYGVKEYWLVDMDAMSVTILGLRRRQRAYATLASGTGDRPLASRVLQGLELRPSDVFADLED
ncbi:MAG: Uma2 family endonuclease [Candidatus Riflebacteria bacterium]|nr:Uma2 family endonuclease [Candidatus Riflebacteria bacterium]